jgi:hypothetical protein
MTATASKTRKTSKTTKTAKTAKTTKAKAEPKEKNTERDEALVYAYLDLATARNSNTWDFFVMAREYSVRVVKDSIKEGQAISGYSLPDVTPTKAQYFSTLGALQDKFEVSASIPFSKAISLAGKADVTLKAEGARDLIAKSATLKDFADALPKTTRKARPASEKGADFAGVVTEGASIEEMLEGIVSLAQGIESAERAKWASALVATAKLIKAMNTASAKA